MKYNEQSSESYIKYEADKAQLRTVDTSGECDKYSYYVFRRVYEGFEDGKKRIASLRSGVEVSSGNIHPHLGILLQFIWVVKHYETEKCKRNTYFPVTSFKASES